MVLNLSASSRRHSNAGGFTLVELLVAMGVLLLMLVLFTQAVGGVSTAWRGAEGRMNNHTKARALLGRLQTDIDSMVLRDDLVAFPEDGEKFGLYTLRKGVYDGVSGENARSLSYVEYEFDADRPPGRLRRRDKTFSYTGGGDNVLDFGRAVEAPPSGTPEPNATPDRGRPPETDDPGAWLADGILGFEWAFLKHNGEYSRTLDYIDDDGVARTAKGVVVALLVIDEKAIQGLNSFDEGALADLKDDLNKLQEDKDSPKWDPKREWEEMLGLRVGGNANVAKSYPSRFIQGIRAFERVYLFPDNGN